MHVNLTGFPQFNRRVEESSYTPQIRNHTDDVDALPELELKKSGEKKVHEESLPADVPAEPSNEGNQATDQRRIIRFDDDDPGQPNNWNWVRCPMHLLRNRIANCNDRNTRYMPFSLQ